MTAEETYLHIWDLLVARLGIRDEQYERELFVWDFLINHPGSGPTRHRLLPTSEPLTFCRAKTCSENHHKHYWVELRPRPMDDYKKLDRRVCYLNAELQVLPFHLPSTFAEEIRQAMKESDHE